MSDIFTSAVSAQVTGIIKKVQSEGDAALVAMAREFDGVSLESLEVPRAALRKALDGIDKNLRRAMERTVKNLETVQKSWMPVATEIESEPGVLVGRRPDALARVGVYAPGGRAAYPSSVLMGCVPAKVAGVSEIILCSPPSPPGKSGLPSDVVMAAAELGGADRVFAVGGAGAIAAMAYGTTTVPRVDKIVGPGNAYVAEAKMQVASVVGIDSPAGPSELLVIADDSANPEVIAREVMAQAEHDPLARVTVLVVGCDTQPFVQAIDSAISNQPRKQIIEQALKNEKRVQSFASMDEAIRVANDFAAEHLLLVVKNSQNVLDKLRSCGTVFIGEYSSVAFGDYMTGANHVLPTGGMARWYSGLSVLDFIRWTTYQRVSADAAASMSEDVGIFADSEGLSAHATAARAWKR